MSLLGPKNGTTSATASNMSPDNDGGDAAEENSCCESDEDFTNNQQTTAAITSEPSVEGQMEQTSATSKSPGHSTLRSVDSRPSVHGIYAEMPASSTYIENMSPMALFNEDRMRRKLQFFFMNPIEKWQARRRFPFKFVVQVVKIVLVTMQLCLFAHSRYNHINYTWDNRISFSHLFLKGWDSTRETESYPPSNGPLAIYEKNQFFDTIDFAIVSYANVSRSIGPYDYPTKNNQMAPMKLCIHSYRQGIIFGFNESYIFDPEIVRHCELITKNVSAIGIEKFLRQRDVNISFSALVEASLEFGIKTINFKAYGPLAAPDCFKFDIKIIFNNRDHDGQMLLSLDADAMRLHCRGDIKYITDAELDTILRTILNLLVIVVCMLSFGLCARAIYRAQLLRIQTVNFFKVTYKKDLSFDGKMEFINMWYITIFLNDILLIIGSILTNCVENESFFSSKYISPDTSSICIGLGNLLVWVGVLRYFGFFKSYNIVIVTLRRSAHKLTIFLFGAMILGFGFAVCGWIVFGPYNIKFNSLKTTLSCLFSLINGDEVFAAFAMVSGKSKLILFFARIYLYTFVIVFSYVVLYFFKSIIEDTYETIKNYYLIGFPISDLRKFVRGDAKEDHALYIMIIFNDLLLIIGSAMKEQIERKLLVIDGWDICSVFLGIGNLLVWIGVLRYLGFFKTYNVVILTLQRAAPKIARFLFCALLIYAGFTFCGWLVLGPYHMKFRSLATTSECLFSLINGDDMFATFATLSSKSNLLWIFCQVYLYSFISLYIYVVLSLFIAVIMDAYDTIKRYYGEGFPLSDLREFVGTRTEEDITSGVFLTDFDDFGDSTIMNVLKRVCCCFSGNETPNGPTGYTSLHTVGK